MSKDDSHLKPNRRDFIKGATVGALAAGLSSHVSLSSAVDAPRGKTPFDYDVLIVGGGFAGVTAARDAKENGYRCVILEARNRLGGRTFYQAPFGDQEVELGGTWIHWMQPFVWAETMRYGLEIKETPGATAERLIQIKDGKRIEPDIVKLFTDLYAGGKKISDKGMAIWPRPFDADFSMEEILKADSDSIHDLLNNSDLTPDQIEIFQRLLSGGVNSKTSHVSANEAYRIFALCGQNIASYYDTNARYQLKEGTISLINKMIEDGKPEVRLNTPVKRIEQKSDHVVITTRAGEILTAATLVCTIPLNVLKDVEFFSPPLDPDKLAASKEGHPGKGFKVFAQIKGEVPKVLLYGNKDIGLDEALTYHIGKESSLIACFGNDRADFDTNDADKMQKALEQFLPGIEVTGSYGYDWIADPYSQGTWCVWRPDWYRKYGKGLRDGAEGRVFFASADFCAGNRGYIDGAIGSGIKAAQQIKELLG